ncbi:MAG: hypothetical protein J6M44_04325 [Butyrivibrio sp.]|uniref:hypothetical protein n=1 Tax=Butyrivibrio sp. TaxID=28121 RepID=UPI001B5B3DE4|nr:hypothetical protein [Butyrivibrio sp.]MBP3278166.1 hypothetical protein [Butyrivibrio sp.]MBP3782097.1 hypothetical protein [Butyrivibrio sp.]
MSILLDNYRKVGDGITSLKEETVKMEEATKDAVVKPFNITFLSYCPIEAKQKEGKTPFWKITKPTIEDFLNGSPLPTGTVPNEFFGSEELLEEVKKTSGLCLLIDGRLYIVSTIAIPTFTLRAEVKGDMTIQVNNVVRDMHLADAVYRKNEDIHLVYREEEIGGVTVRKVFAGLGSAYKLIPQTIIANSVEKLSEDGTMGAPVVSSFEIDHGYTSAHVILPEIGEEIAEEYKLSGEVIPGLYLSTSDIGQSSVIIRGVYNKGASTVITDEVVIKHVGKNLTPEVILGLADEKIFSSIRKLPEALAELMGTEVMNYSSLDLSKPKDQAKNKKAVLKVISEELKRVCREAKVSGKKEKELLECLEAEINEELCYTYYDIAMIFMGVPARITGLDRDTVARLQKACGQTPYKLSKKPATADEEEIALLPA